MSSYSSSDEEDNLECPLCMEEIDLADKYFKPCVCGYQVCRFCWHHIKEDLNGLCPGCRREYTEEMVQFKPVSPEKLAQLKAKRKAKKREKKEQENNARKHYANVRVIQKNLVYVIGLPSYVANEETIKQYDYFGQYGKITKVVINKKTHSPHQSTVGIYITYSKKEEAERAIEAVDNIIFDGRQVKASYGTTKYCTFYLRGQTCQNPSCMYLHEPGEEIESKEDLLNKTQVLSAPSTPHVKEIKPSAQPKPIKTTIYREKDETSALPATANWGSRNSKAKLEEGGKKMSFSLSEFITKSNENSKNHNINISRSKSDSQSSLKMKNDSKIKPISIVKSNSSLSISSMNNEINKENLKSEKITKNNSNRDEEYPALSSLLNKKNNQSKESHSLSKEGRSLSHPSINISPNSLNSKLKVEKTTAVDNNKDNVHKEKEIEKTVENNIKDVKNENIEKESVENDNSKNNNESKNNDIIAEEKTEAIPKTESPELSKEEVEIDSENKIEVESNKINEISKSSILEEISKAYTYTVDKDSSNSNISSPQLNLVSTPMSTFNIFSEINKSQSEAIKENKSKNVNSPPPGFENKMETKISNPSNLTNSFSNDINQSIADMKITEDDEVMNNNSNHLNEFKYNGPFDPFNDVMLNNLMNANAIMNSFSKNYLRGFNGYNNMYNNAFNVMNPLMNEPNFSQFQNQLNQKYLEQYYQNLNREQIQNNLRAMLPNINISPYSNSNETNPWSNSLSPNSFNDNLFNSFNSLAAAFNGNNNNNNNMFYNNNFNNNNNMNLLKQLQMTQMLNNLQKSQQQMENNLSIINNMQKTQQQQQIENNLTMLNNIQKVQQQEMENKLSMLNNIQKVQQQMDNNISMTNNINLNNSTQDYKSLPFKDSAIMAVKMSNNNSTSIENANPITNNISSMNLFQNLNMKPNDLKNNNGMNMNPVSPINSFASLNQINQMNGLNGIINLNGMNSLNNGLNNLNNMNTLRNITQMNGFSDINSMNMTSNSLTSPVIPSSVSLNAQNFKGMNELNKEGLGGLATSMNSMYEDEKMKFFQKFTEMNKDEQEKEYGTDTLPDFWRSKIQDTGGGNNKENSDLLSNSILEQRFNEAEQKSLDLNKHAEDLSNKEKYIKNEFELNKISNNKAFQMNELEENNEKSLKKPKTNSAILDILTKKPIEDIKKDESKENEDEIKINKEKLVINEDKNNDSKNEDIEVNKNNESSNEIKEDTVDDNSKKSKKESNEFVSKENINKSTLNTISISKSKKKEKSENQKIEEKREENKMKDNNQKSEPLIIKFEPKKPKQEEPKKEQKDQQFVIKLEEKKLRKEESMRLVISKKSRKEEKNQISSKKVVKEEKKNKKDNSNILMNQNNIFEVLPDVTQSETLNEFDERIEENKTQETKDQDSLTENLNASVTSNSKKNKKKSKHKKKKAKSSSFVENDASKDKEIDIPENNNFVESSKITDNESINQSKKKKKSKKKNNDIELHILTVKDNKTQLMKETQLYRLPLTAIARKLIPDDSGTTLGLKPVFPPDIEIEALCNVIVTKRGKKKKRENINLPFFKSKIGQLKSELEDEKIDFNYIDDVDENIVIEGNNGPQNLMKTKPLDILNNHNMEVNMITSLKQIKRRNLNNTSKLEEMDLNDESNLEESDLIEKLNEDFLDEDIDEIKENLNINSKSLIDMKMANELIEKQKFMELNKQIIDHNENSNTGGQFFVFQALDALINTAEVYANALKKQIEEYEKKECNLEDSNRNSSNYKRKVKIYEAVLESIKDIKEMGLSDYKTLEKLYFSDVNGEENYEENINNLLISVKYIMQELVLNVDEQELLPQILTLNKNTNILLSKMNGNKFKDSVLQHYKKLSEEGRVTSNNLNDNSTPSVLPSQLSKSKAKNTQNLDIVNKDKSDVNEVFNDHNDNCNVLPPLPPLPATAMPIKIEKTITKDPKSKSSIPEIIEPESLKMVNQNIKKFLKDCKLEETHKKMKNKKHYNENPSSSNIELKIEYENEEVKNRIEKMSKSDNELLNSTEDILLELILKSQENQELKTKLISNCLNFDVNLAKRLAASLRRKEKDKEKNVKNLEKSNHILKSDQSCSNEQQKIISKASGDKNKDVEITVVDGEVIIKKHSNDDQIEFTNNNNEIVIESKKKKKDN